MDEVKSEIKVQMKKVLCLARPLAMSRWPLSCQFPGVIAQEELVEHLGFIHQEDHGQAPVPVLRHSLISPSVAIKNNNNNSMLQYSQQ